MRKLMLAGAMVFALALTASAQGTKQTGKAHCAKADPGYSIDVGDKPGHALMLQKTACTWTAGVEMAGSKATAGDDVSTMEVSGATGHSNGYHVATMDNGDKFLVRYQGTARMNKDGTGTIEGKWSYVSGTGKLKGLKGSGTYQGTMAADGSTDFDVEGEYTIPEAKPMAPAKKAPAKKMGM
jgi:hypothetical protein